MIFLPENLMRFKRRKSSVHAAQRHQLVMSNRSAIPQSFEELLITQGVWADSSFRQISFCLPRGVSVLS
jgi:hypothetical protein